MSRKHIFRTLCASALALTSFAQIALAQAYNDITQQLNGLDKSVDGVVQRVTIFLQSGGRWYPLPKGNDMLLCQGLHDFKKQIQDFTRETRGSTNDSKVQSMANRLLYSSNNIENMLRTVGADPITMAQWSSTKPYVMSIVQLSNVPHNSPFNPTPGTWPPSGNSNVNPFGLTLLSAQLVNANTVALVMNEYGRTANYTSQLDSFVLNDGRQMRAATGQKVAMLSQAYAQVRSTTPPSTIPPIALDEYGHGNMLVLGQPAVPIVRIALQSDYNDTERIKLDIYASNGFKVSFKGKVSSMNAYSAMIQLRQSDAGKPQGSVRIDFGAGGRISMLHASGTLDNKPFSLEFNG